MKNNIDFYQHYANADQHPKFKMLRSEYGWSGEGKFWALNNRIAQAENCQLDISKKYNRAAVANDLNFKLVDFDKFIAFLLNDCELIQECEIGVYTTDIVQENFQKVSSDRKSARERSRRRWENTHQSSPEKKQSSPEKVSKVKESKVKELICRVVDYLNRKTNSNYQPTTKDTIRLITARHNEGFTADNFKIVIDFKCKQWLGDGEKQEFLRPQTLFSNKFEGYLNAAHRAIETNSNIYPLKTDEEIAEEQRRALL
jgi:uncharacterized phage protein (TIGR02220 family)